MITSLLRRTLSALLILLGASSACASPRESVTFTNVATNGVLNAPTNTVQVRTLTGGYPLGRIDFSGTLTSVNANTWSSDSRILLTAPSGESVIVVPFRTGGPFSTLTVAHSVFMPAVAAVTGDWTFRFYETVDNGAGVDARWTLTVSFTDEPPVAPAATDLGNLSSPGLGALAFTLAPAQVRWFAFTVPCGVRRSRGQYLDVDTVGSVLAGGGGTLPDDTQLALYDSSGRLITSNDDGGQGFLAQLSFGTGFSDMLPSGDGLPFNGSDGALAPGTYYLAVGSYRMVLGPDRWFVTPLGSQSGNVVVRLRTNLTGSQPCPCPADFNGVGGLTVQDIFDFLTAYFTGSSEADFNATGSVTVQDIFDFLAAYFAGCP